MRALFLVIVLIIPAFPANGADTAWVAADKLARYSCPARSCGIVGELSRGDELILLEKHEGWARITIPYMASCRNGVNLLVQQGNNLCSKENGVIEGYMAEWVEMEFLGVENK